MKRRTNANGNDNFYSNNKDLAPANIKLKKVAKFEEKLLVYIVISPRGVSEPFIQPSGNAVNQFIYRDNCLASLLLPFIKNTILMEITSFGRTWQAAIMPNTQ